MQEINVPIVFSTDDNYIIPTSVAITSIVVNFSGKRISFFILSKEELNETSKSLLDRASRMNENVECTINYIIIEQKLLFGDLQSHMGHITMPAYYRLLIPDLLVDFNKCIYLDGDICVPGDIMEFYSKDVSNHYVAGVLAFDIVSNTRNLDKRLKILNIENQDNYINSGVMLLNLEALRKDDMSSILVNIAKKDLPVQDQDVINVGCFGKILLVSPVFNAMPSLFSKSVKKLSSKYSIEDVILCKEKPIIIHYANRYKPWLYYDTVKCDIWDYYYKLLFGNVEIQRTSMKFKSFFEKWKYRLKNFFKF